MLSRSSTDRRHAAALVSRRGRLVLVSLAALALVALAGLRATAFGVNVRMSVKPDRRDDFLEAIRKHQKATLDNEPLSVEYLFGQDAKDENVFHVHEHYKGQEGYDMHKEASHLKDWNAFKDSDPFTQPPERNYFLVSDLPKDDKLAWEKRYVVNSKYSVKAEERELFLMCIGCAQRDAGTEFKELEWLFGEDLEHPNTFIFHEQYVGKEGYEEHLKEKHYGVWQRFVGETGRFSEPPQVSTFTED